MTIGIEIEQFIIDELLAGKDIKKVGAEDSLIESNVLDSLGLIRLITFIEQQFGIPIRDDDVTPENFQTINSIKTFIESKRKSS
jgi:acyl carrier protein